MPVAGPTYDFNWSNVNNASPKQGVYILYQDGRQIYIGSAVNPGETLRSCLQAHKGGDLGTSTQGATTFQIEATENSADAANKERDLMWGYQYINRRTPRYNDPL